MAAGLDPEKAILIYSDTEDGSTDAQTQSNSFVPPSGVQDDAQTFESCLPKILELFPDVSHDHVHKLWEKNRSAISAAARQTTHSIIEYLLGHGAYPKERDRLRSLKRKRDSPDIEAVKWRSAKDRGDPISNIKYGEIARAALAQRFDSIPVKFIGETFINRGNYYEAFFALDKADRDNHGLAVPAFTRLKKSRAPASGFDRLMSSLDDQGGDPWNLREEMSSAKQAWDKESARRQSLKEAADAKLAQDEQHRIRGEVQTCACCFADDVPISDVTYCSAEEPHYFCLDCARRNAENDIGDHKYALRCMDQSRCEFTFSRQQRARFLDQGMIDNIDRLQQQDEIRQAGIDDLEHCPFCDYAESYPAVEVFKEFVCQNSTCFERSCRLCREKSHVPMSCEEFRKEKGVSQRRVIEEARTEALLRTCRKCNVRILKEDGCNKVVCTSCLSVLCDFCGEDISKTKYDHFNRAGTDVVGADGKCPLYDSSPQGRKEKQIEKAGKEAMDKIRLEHPDLSEEELQIKFSDRVKESTRSDTHRALEYLGGDLLVGIPRRRMYHHQQARPIQPQGGREQRQHGAIQHNPQFPQQLPDADLQQMPERPERRRAFLPDEAGEHENCRRAFLERARSDAMRAFNLRTMRERQQAALVHGGALLQPNGQLGYLAGQPVNDPRVRAFLGPAGFQHQQQQSHHPPHDAVFPPHVYAHQAYPKVPLDPTLPPHGFPNEPYQFYQPNWNMANAVPPAEPPAAQGDNAPQPGWLARNGAIHANAQALLDADLRRRAATGIQPHQRPEQAPMNAQIRQWPPEPLMNMFQNPELDPGAILDQFLLNDLNENHNLPHVDHMWDGGNVNEGWMQARPGPAAQSDAVLLAGGDIPGHRGPQQNPRSLFGNVLGGRPDQPPFPAAGPALAAAEAGPYGTVAPVQQVPLLPVDQQPVVNPRVPGSGPVIVDGAADVPPPDDGLDDNFWQDLMGVLHPHRQDHDASTVSDMPDSMFEDEANPDLEDDV